jgi:aryl-alcohol dehydrogenase-like predicted oxidoreductase
MALSGCRTPAEIEENVRALDTPVPDDALAEIDQIMTGTAGQSDVVPGRHHVPTEQTS